MVFLVCVCREFKSMCKIVECGIVCWIHDLLECMNSCALLLQLELLIFGF